MELVSDPSADFDEEAYLSANPDVRDAVAAGTVPSGLVHYLSWGRHEKRPRPVGRRPLTRRDKVNEVWSVSPEEKSEALGWYWMAHPMVRERINTLVSGDQSLDAYARLGAWLSEHGRKLPLDRSISLGCGFGGLERDLASRGMIREMDAFDLAAGAITEARRLAEEAGYGWIRYHLADLEAQDFPSSHYDAVFAHSSVHHVERLEVLSAACTVRCVRVVSSTSTNTSARRGSSGPMLSCTSSTVFLTPSRNVFVKRGGRKPPVLRPTIEQMVAMDPTEAVRRPTSAGYCRSISPSWRSGRRRHFAASRARRHRAEF